MKKNIFTVLMLISVVIVSNTKGFAFGIAKITVNVVDENGQPLADTKVRVRFSGGEMPLFEKTDDHGNCTVSASSKDGVVVGTAIKDGYYESTFHQDFYVKKLGFWQPFGKELTVVLRQIINPVPMYVRNSSFKIPVKNQEIGFDLEKADWVIPHGRGTMSDFIFKIDEHYESDVNYDARMAIRFSNPHDGIQIVRDDGGGDFNVGSRFRLLRTAPIDGYILKIEKRNSWDIQGRHVDMNNLINYIFRVRSEVDENGNFKKAIYGKIIGDIWYTPGGGGKISMNYYLNPDNTQNLEYDPKRNLFVSLPSDENVTQP